MNERLRKLMEQRAQAVAAMRALLDAADAESRDLTAEEEGTYTRHDQDVDRLTNEIQREERMAQLETEQRESANGERNPAQRRQPGEAGSTGERRDLTDSNEYRQAMLNYLVTGVNAGLRTDARSNELRDILGVSITGDGATGGVLAPSRLERSLLEDIANENVVRSLADVRSSTSDVEIPYASTHTQAYLIAEGAAFTASTPAFDKKTMRAYKVGALSYVTHEAMQDMFIDIEAWLRDDFAQAFADLEETHFISGTGLGQPSGILTGGTSALTAASATAITGDELIDLVYAVPEKYRKKGHFLLKDTSIKLIRKLKDGQGQYIWQPGLQAGQPDSLLGYPVHTSSAMEAAAAGKKAVVFGDFKQFRVLDRRGLYFQRLVEIAATTGQVGFLAYRRYDSQVMHSNALQYITMHA